MMLYVRGRRNKVGSMVLGKDEVWGTRYKNTARANHVDVFVLAQDMVGHRASTKLE